MSQFLGGAFLRVVYVLLAAFEVSAGLFVGETKQCFAHIEGHAIRGCGPEARIGGAGVGIEVRCNDHGMVVETSNDELAIGAK